ncbi:MAG TPA: carboxypeptidase regulatory-like domain-containing protein [Casimicrobiaceae bacterium]|nr:carboxypeptidase regulatory-like domain-containing protein [Casimicrobiaceae bacterium]
MQRLTLVAGLAVAGLVASGPVLALAMSNLPPEETQGSVTYRTGGIGHEEATAMRRAEASYPLSLEFVGRAEPHNWFLANVEFTIKDHRGNVALRTYSDGPIVLARLPDGRYTVTATDDGKSETRRVDIAAGKPERLVFIW